jgi:alkanesulfonate monooxygenase SsuD/methylene tetrahydromethanopterin reductase-like flavin-dependent oxidoreductase (luciferase family)
MAKRLALQVGFGGAGKERDELIERVRIAADLGVEAAFVAEAWGRDAFTFLTELVLKTEKIKLGTAIVNVFSRSPAVLAMTMASLDEMSGNRMILGLGSSGANVIEDWHGVPFKKPLKRLREYVEIINMIMRGERLEYEGELFQFGKGFRLGRGGPENFGPLREHVPTFIAAITPKSVVQTGEIADGWIPVYWPLERGPRCWRRGRRMREGR